MSKDTLKFYKKICNEIEFKESYIGKRGEFVTEIEEIYHKYFTDVYKYALSLCRNENLAEEITQETFFKALKRVDDFKGNCKMRVWLCQIAKNGVEENVVYIYYTELIRMSNEQFLKHTKDAILIWER